MQSQLKSWMLLIEGEMIRLRVKRDDGVSVKSCEGLFSLLRSFRLTTGFLERRETANANDSEQSRSFDKTTAGIKHFPTKSSYIVIT